jgi:formylglycine-generating enzyme
MSSRRFKTKRSGTAILCTVGSFAAVTACHLISGLSSLEIGDPQAPDGANRDIDAQSKSDATMADASSDARVSGDTGVDAPPLFVPPSCTGLPSTCGSTDAGSCCESHTVTGGSFVRRDDWVFTGGTFVEVDGGSFPATVSDFSLDVYEITVGRFRKFVEAGKGTQTAPPPKNAGARVGIAKSGWDDVAWNGFLAPNTQAIKSALICYPPPDTGPPISTWTDTAANNETKPLNCMTWYEAFAFCAWDGGFLPTEAEWNYAASGGTEQRRYPWGATPPNPLLASIATGGDVRLPSVGSAHLGQSRFGQDDMAGSVWEWVLDRKAPYPSSCANCADTTTVTFGHSERGGSTYYSLFGTENSFRGIDDARNRAPGAGARCARPAP